MKLKTLEKRFETQTDKQFIGFVKRYCEGRKEYLLNILEELVDYEAISEFNSKESMDKLIVKFRKEIADYFIELFSSIWGWNWWIKN